MGRPEPRQLLILALTGVYALTLTLGAWWSARSDAESEARIRFASRTSELAEALRGRMLDYEQVLRGCVALFDASDRVTRREWRSYVRGLALERIYPGVRGIGFAPHVGADGLAGHESAARADGYPQHAVFPAGTRPEYAPVLYIEPFEDRNLLSFGFDLYADGVRRAALDAARDSGQAALSGRAPPVPGTDPDTQAGVILFLPLYRSGAPAATVAERRAALAGFVYSPFRVGDLLAGVLGREPGVQLRLLDVTAPGEPELLFEGARDGVQPRFEKALSLAIGGRSWRLEVASRPALEAEIEGDRPALVLAAGLAITALLMLIVWSLSTTRERAREMAHHMTVALRASEERLQLALASSHLALFDWDVPAGLVQLSAEWPAMLGGAAEPALVPIQKLQMLVHPDEAAAVQARLAALLKGEVDSYRVEHRVRRLDGSWLWIESTARVNGRGPDGRALRVTGANSDIEERKAVERLKSEFIATVSHELRTPLTNILASLALIREGSVGELTPEARGFVEIAYSNSERLTDLVNDILDMERIEAGHVEMHIEAVDLTALLGRALELNGAYAERYAVRFALSAPLPGMRALADPDRLMQVLTNLLSNAAKHSPSGGEVAVTLAEQGATMRISVSDHGPGIAPELRPRLFGKFEQARGAKGGSGLGLAISKALVERMQGRIGCDSEPGKGSTFWVELPRA